MADSTGATSGGPFKALRERRKRLGAVARKRGIYVLPSAFTTTAMFAGFYSIMSSMDLRFTEACWAIVIAVVFDMLDGRVARMTNTTSAFGMNYDSMADLISFGVAPALLSYHWVLRSFGQWGWVAAFVYVACAAIRLARFNVGSADKAESTYFLGLASPAAAGLVLTPILLHQKYPEIFERLLGIQSIEGTIRHPLFVGLVFFCGFMMVSEVPFRTFKEVNLRDKKPFIVLPIFIVMLATLYLYPELVMFSIGYLYAGSQIFLWLTSGVRPRKEVLPEGADAVPDPAADDFEDNVEDEPPLYNNGEKP